MPEFQLITEIIARSVAETWDAAKLEWSLLERVRGGARNMPLWSFPDHRAVRALQSAQPGAGYSWQLLRKEIHRSTL